MSSRYRVFHCLDRLSAQDADPAMAAALATADEDAARLIVPRLLDHASPQPTVALVAWFDRLPGDMQELIVERIADLDHALRRASAQRSGDAPANAVEIVHRARAAPLTYLVVEALRSKHPTLWDAAAACLLGLTESVTEPANDGKLPLASDVEFVFQGVAEATQAYGTHQRAAVLQALALVLPRAWLPVAVNCLSDVRHPATAAMRQVLASGEGAAMARAALALLRLPTLSDAAAVGLRMVARRGEFSTLMEASHLLLAPPVAKGLQRQDAAADLLPPPRVCQLMDADEGRGLVRWIAHLPMDAALRVQRLAALASAPAPATRLAALTQLMVLSSDPEAFGASDVIASFTADDDSQIARIALRHLVRTRYSDLSRLALKLVNSAHLDVRRLASGMLAPLGFERLWQAWPRLTEEQQLDAGRALIKIDPDFHRHLAEKLAQSDRATRLRAISILQGLNQCAAFEEPLIALLNGRDEVVAASAARALGTAQGPQASEALHAALENPDSRVRANAIEALQQFQSTQHVQKLVEMAQGEENRPRANAIGALMEMRTPEALGALVGMINDPRPEQRVSALWLASHMGLVEVARHVAERSVSDPDPEVRARADKVIQQLIESLTPASTGAAGTAAVTGAAK